MNAFTPPFKVHVCWFRSSDDPRCADIVRELYEFLHRPLDDDFVLRPGVDIPVEVGRDLAGLVGALETGAEPAVGTRLVIALLDSSAFDDPVAHRAVEHAAKRWSDRRRDEVFLPLLLDKRWSATLQQGGAEALVGIAVRGKHLPWLLSADVGVVAGRALLRRLHDADPPRPHVFISHAKADGAELASKLAQYMRAGTRVNAWYDETDIDRGEELGRQLEHATSDGIVLVVRTDRYSESPWCALELLSAKRARVPIVTLLGGDLGEPSASAYGGNHRTMTWKSGREDEIVARCVQAWLHGHYFRQYASAALALAGLPADSEILTRRPELLDVADGSATRRLLIHPDPPLTDAEATVLRNARPTVRIATPTTLFGRVLLSKDPEPPLSGVTIAFSLSTAEELPPFERAIENSAGLTQQHSNDVLYSIVTTTVHSGAKIAFGGDFRRAGFSQMLSDLLRSRRRLGNSAGTQLVAYMRAYKQAAIETEAKSDIEYLPVLVPMPNGTPPGVSDELQPIIWHLAMRNAMAQQSHARVLLGGKTKPKSAAAPDGYRGPWPGVLEEAWRTLRSGRALFVVGGFAGAAGLIAKMLRTHAIPLEFQRATWPVLKPFNDEFDQVRTAILPTTSPDLVLQSSDGGLQDIEDIARAILDDWSRSCADEISRWSNGLTKAENERLFASTDPTEITHLIFEGLRRLRSKSSSPVRVVAYEGDIALVPDVDAYAATITPGVQPGGASAALDKRMGGRLASIEPSSFEQVCSVATSGDLVGSYVLIAKLALPPGTSATVTQVAALAEAVARDADRLGLQSIAWSAFASTMGLRLDESVAAMLRGVATAAPRAVKTLVFCETSAARYALLRDALRAAGAGEIVELRPGPVAQPIEQSVVLSIEAGEVSGGWHVRSMLFLPDGRDAVVPREETTLDTATWNELRKRARKFDASLALGNRLWNKVLSADIRSRLQEHRNRPLVVLTDDDGAGLPWEFLTNDEHEQIACLRGVVRRIALTGKATAPDREPRTTRRVLLVVDPSENLPNTAVEADNIQAVLRERPDIEVMRLEGKAATRDAVCKCLATGQYDIFHYAGHATFKSQDRAESGLILADELLTASKWPDARTPRFIYLSGCESLRVRSETAGVAIDEAPDTQSLAEALLRRGVAALVGTFFVVSDSTAQQFASKMYRQITAGHTLGTAVLEARMQLKSVADWGNFMLYGDDQLII